LLVCTSTVAEHDVIPTAMFSPLKFLSLLIDRLDIPIFFEHAHTPLMSMRSYWLKQGQKVQDKIEIVNSKSLGQSHCQFHQCDIVVSILRLKRFVCVSQGCRARNQTQTNRQHNHHLFIASSFRFKKNSIPFSEMGSKCFSRPYTHQWLEVVNGGL